MENFYFQDLESVNEAIKKLELLTETDSYRYDGTSPAVRLQNYKEQYTRIDGAEQWREHNGEMVLWDVRLEQPFDRDIAIEYSTNEYNMNRYGSETPRKDLKFLKTLKEYYELKDYYGSESFTKRDESNRRQTTNPLAIHNWFQRKRETREGVSELAIGIEGKLLQKQNELKALFPETRYFNDSINERLNKDDATNVDQVSLKDSSTSNRTQELAIFNPKYNESLTLKDNTKDLALANQLSIRNVETRRTA